MNNSQNQRTAEQPASSGKAGAALETQGSSGATAGVSPLSSFLSLPCIICSRPSGSGEKGDTVLGGMLRLRKPRALCCALWPSLHAPGEVIPHKKVAVLKWEWVLSDWKTPVQYNLLVTSCGLKSIDSPWNLEALLAASAAGILFSQLA